MVNNVLNAIYNLSRCRDFNLAKTKKYVSNVVSEQGAPLEKFVRASFCGIPDTNKKAKGDRVFCDEGHVKNPPDAMI